MIDFLLAIFGGSYYYGRHSYEKAKLDSIEEHREIAEEINKCLKVSIEENFEITNILINPGIDKIKKRETMLDSICDELKEMYGDNWKDKFMDINPSNTCLFFCDQWGFAYRFLLSKMGKLPGAPEVWYELSGQKELVEQKIKACKIIERNIQKFYPGLKMYYLPGQNYYHRGKNTNEIIYYDDISKGQLWWEHALLPGIKKETPIKRLW